MHDDDISGDATQWYLPISNIYICFFEIYPKNKGFKFYLFLVNDALFLDTLVSYRYGLLCVLTFL